MEYGGPWRCGFSGMTERPDDRTDRPRGKQLRRFTRTLRTCVRLELYRLARSCPVPYQSGRIERYWPGPVQVISGGGYPVKIDREFVCEVGANDGTGDKDLGLPETGVDAFDDRSW